MRNLILAQTDVQARVYRDRLGLGHDTIYLHSSFDCWHYLGRIMAFRVFLACDPIYLSSNFLLSFADKTAGRTLVFHNESQHEDFLYHLSIIQERKEVIEQLCSQLVR